MIDYYYLLLIIEGLSPRSGLATGSGKSSITVLSLLTLSPVADTWKTYVVPLIPNQSVQARN